MSLDVAALSIRRTAALRAKASAVNVRDPDVARVARALIDLCKDHDGLGLAAPQVGLSWRLFVAAVPTFTVFINPKIVMLSGGRRVEHEGCLSLPGVSVPVSRALRVKIQAVGVDGVPFVRGYTGIAARCIQHEYDHLKGVLITSRRARPGSSCPGSTRANGLKRKKRRKRGAA